MTNWDKILGDIIRPFLASEHQQTFDYIFLGGKKIRPSYIEKLCHFYKKEAKPLYHAAAAIELFHAFSLVHDDIVDNESERRGKLPLHREKSVSEAILYGDFFYTVAFQILLAGHYSAEINQEFARSFQLVCEGQLMESVVDKKEWNQKIYFDYIHKKTVALFELCTFTVGTYFSLPKKDQDFLYKHGSILGEWFQIKNDLKTPEEKQFNFCNYFSEDERKKILTEKEIFLEKYPNLNPA